MSCGEPLHQFAKPDLFRGRGAVHENIAFGVQTAEHIHRVNQRSVLHQHDIRFLNRLMKPNLMITEPGKSGHRRARALGTETREGLGEMSFHESCQRQHFRGSYDTLPSAAVQTNLKHKCATSAV